MKKLMAILMAFAITLTSAFQIYAGEVEYAEVLKTIKTMFDVEDYEEFSYDVSNSEQTQTYFFSWSDEEKGSLDITADKDMNIYNYHLYKDTEGENIITKAEANVIADEFLKKVNSGYSCYKLSDTIPSIDSVGYIYDAYINSHKVLLGEVYITVDLKLGKVTSYSTDLPISDENVKNIKPVSIDTVKKALFEEDNLKLSYKAVREDDKTIKKPLYTFENVFVDAETGSLSITSENNYSAKYASTSEDAVAAGADNGLTEVEIKEISDLGNAPSVSEAVELMEKKFGIDIDEKNEYFANSYFKGENGYNLTIYCYDDYDFHATINSDRIITNMSYNGKNIISGYDNIKNYVKNIYPNADIPSNIKDNEYDGTYSYTFYDKHNNITDNSRFIRISFDDNYNVNHIYYCYDTNEYEEITKPLTNDEIFNIAKDNGDFGLYYYPDEKGNLKLVYTFEKKFSIDGATGEFLTYYGTKFSPDDFYEYSDVAGTWYENIANSLINEGHRFKENKFEGDKIVTGEDIVQFMSGSDIAEYARYYNSNKYAKYAENPEIEITKYEMAKIIIDNTEFSRLVKTGEFLKPFEDVDEENNNYVAICKALGIAKGDNGKFNGTAPITRAEMAAMVYYSLQR